MSSRSRTHLSRSWRTILSTSGRGQTVSRFPRGIWSTRLVELGTTVTMRDPRSTARLMVPSTLASGLRRLSEYAVYSAPLSSARSGTNLTSCAKVVKMRYSAVQVNEVASEASRRAPA